MYKYFILFAFIFSGCQYGVVTKPKSPEAVVEDEAFKTSILNASENGYWLVVRGYKITDHMVATSTLSDYSHAAILDIKNKTVIEADSKGVHETNLDNFIHNSFLITVVKPLGYDVYKGDSAIMIARGKIGKPYDFLGLIGVNESEKYYCSELTLFCYPGIRKIQKIPQVIKPSYLLKLGETVYETPERTVRK